VIADEINLTTIIHFHKLEHPNVKLKTMKKRLLFLFSICSLLFALSVNGQNFVNVTKSYDGQTVYLSTDQVLEVSLPKIPSSGYTWCELNSSDDKTIQQTIEQIGDGDFIADAGTGTSVGKVMVGQSGSQIIRYIGTSEGTTELKLELKRPWETDKPAIDNYSITVISSGVYTGSYTPPVKEIPKHVTSTSKSAPSRWDWRSQCTPIQDQGYCGDCWAFASVGTLEANIKIIDGVNRDISEEFVTDCYTGQGSSGCNGGWCAHEAWLASFTDANPLGGGAVYEADDPTSCNSTGNTGTCSSSGYTPHETIDSYADVAGEDADGVPPDANMKDAIYNYGPIWVAIDASSNAWGNYSGGIHTETGSAANIDHAVILVGYVDSAAIAGGGYWILRNSWNTGWGDNGYMYISYGSDVVGAYADYLVYKGGIPHDVPPIANFDALTTTSCSGIIQFDDASTNYPTSWLWNFGDGATSTLQNPSHTYNSSGTFNVTLTATNDFGDNSITKSSFITINLATAPTTTDGACFGPCSVTLYASGSGTLNWYDAASGGNLINTGTSYITPVLNNTTTYYVQSKVSQPAQSAGMAANTTNGIYFNNAGSNWALIFDAYTDITINSVVVYASGTASRTIWLNNSSGTLINSYTASIANGQQTVPINFSIPAGTGYQLGADGTCNLWRESSGTTFPYTTAGLVSITGNTAAADRYYYFYDWQVQPQACLSPMVPVVANIDITTWISDNPESFFSVFPNPSSGSFDIKSSDPDFQNATVSITNILGDIVFEKNIQNNTTMHVDAANLNPGIYFVKLKTEKSSYTKKLQITD
jgi:C1A family cysteine protease